MGGVWGGYAKSTTNCAVADEFTVSAGGCEASVDKYMERGKGFFAGEAERGPAAHTCCSYVSGNGVELYV